MTDIIKKNKVLIMQRYLVHYREKFFQELTKANPEFEIIIYHGGPISGNVNLNPSGFDHVQYKNYKLNLFGYSLVFQPQVLVSIIRQSPDLIIVEGTFGIVTNSIAILWRKLIGKKTIYWSAGWENPSVIGWKRSIKNKIISILIKMSDGAITYGTSARNYFINHGMSPEKIYIAQNTIDVEGIISQQDYWFLEGDKIRAKYNLENRKVLIYVGGISKLKRVDMLLNAVEILGNTNKDVSCLIVGDGPMKEELIAWCNLRKLDQVIFTGEIINGVEAYIAAADYFILPGIGGLAINQAMALRKPIITSIADGTQEDLVISGVNGHIIDIDSTDSLVHCLSKILNDKNLTINMGKKSQEIIMAKASLKNMVTQFSIAMNEIIKHNQEKSDV